MRIKKRRKLLVVLSVLFAATLMLSSPSQAADGPAPGEGYYAGLFLGYGTGVTQAKVSTVGTNQNNFTGTFEIDRGGLGLAGVQGGGWLGWGMKTPDDLYFGVEIVLAGSDEKFELTSTIPIQNNDGSTFSKVTAKRNFQSGAAVRVGYYINESTLLAFKGGISISSFGVDIGSSNETYYAGGPQAGVSIESKLNKLDPNLSLRLEFVYTDYLTAGIGGQAGVGQGIGGTHDSEITGSDSAGRLGVVYSF